MRPACMDDEEWALWSLANASIQPDARVLSPCFDCLPQFCRLMRNEGRCNGEPGKGLRSPAKAIRTAGPWKYGTEEERVAARRESWRRAKEALRERRARDAA